MKREQLEIPHPTVRWRCPPIAPQQQPNRVRLGVMRILRLALDEGIDAIVMHEEIQVRAPWIERLLDELELGRICERCGCTENAACVDELGGSCSWISATVCSSCATRAELRAIARRR